MHAQQISTDAFAAHASRRSAIAAGVGLFLRVLLDASSRLEPGLAAPR